MTCEDSAVLKQRQLRLHIIQTATQKAQEDLPKTIGKCQKSQAKAAKLANDMDELKEDQITFVWDLRKS